MARVLALLLMLLPMAAAGQDRAQTLADIRQELSALHVEVQRLKGELNTTGLPAAAGVGGDTLARVDAIEQALARLTARTEELQFRIERIVEDGTNRIADLEFRLVELEGGDVSRLRETTTLGGAQAAGVRPVGALPDTGPDTGAGAQLASAEQEDFDAARSALEGGDYAAAAERFADFTATYPGSPLAGEAHFLRGEALSADGRTADAARAYLDSFSGAPAGARAADALLRLGLSLASLGQTQEACLTLGEIDLRFPLSPAATEAAAARQDLNCL